jgi:hypothetical protein
MDENRLDRAGTGPLDDLSPALRRAVEGVLRDPPPEDVTSRALAAARQIGVPRPEADGPTLRWHPRAAWRVLAVAASIGLIAALVWWHWGGPPDRHVVVNPPPSPIGPGNPQPIPQGPEAPQGHRLPTMWAYRQAARQSAEALDAMLAQDARWVLHPEPQSFQVGASRGSVPLTL